MKAKNIIQDKEGHYKTEKKKKAHALSGRHKNLKYIATKTKTSKFVNKTDRLKERNRQIPFITRDHMLLNFYYFKKSKQWVIFTSF